MTNGSFQQAPSGSAPDDRSTEFVAVDPGAEHYSGPKLVVIAYLAIWVVLMAWILMLWRKSASLSDRLEGLERAIDRAAAKADEKKAKAKAS
jgi:CcmD family protein